MPNCHPEIIDYLMANDRTANPPLSASQKADLYAELATGSETGWELSSRWFAGGNSAARGLLRLNVRNVVGPDLNGIMCELSLLPKIV
jgi:alpha,alpha-trehalase